MPDFSHLYIHIPFCVTLCDFCNLYSVKEQNSEKQRIYLNKILSQVKKKLPYLQKIKTIFIGGGTPLSPNSKNIQYFFTNLTKILPKVQEFTVECHTQNTTKEKLEILKSCGINRLSFGGQSHIPRLQKVIGRHNDNKRFINIIEMTKSLGFNNINIDLIYGIPTQSLRDWQYDLEYTLDLGIEHLSTYCLTVHQETKLAQRGVDPDDNEAAQLFIATDKLVKKYNFTRYEVSNFSLPEKQSQHNLGIWQGETYLGIGASACSFDGNQRWQEIPHWEKWIDHNEKIIDHISPLSRSSEIFYTGLRTTQGWNMNNLAKILPDTNLIITLKEKIDYYIQEKFLTRNNNLLQPTTKGLLFADLLAEDFLILDNPSNIIE